MNALHAVLPSPVASQATARSRICGTGEMAELIRRADWGATALGDLAQWPESLLATANLILSSPIPTSVYWGPHHVMLYNDGYRQFLAHRHPESLGKSGAEVWKEAWHIVGPQIEHTYRTAETFQGESFLVPIERNGCLIDHYWNYSFSPIYDSGTGLVAGIYNTCADVTGSVRTAQERDSLSQRLEELLETTSESVIMIDRDWRFTYLNRAAEVFSLPITGLVGKIVWEALPGLVYEGSPNVYHYRRAMEHGESSEFDSFYPEPINRWRHIQVRPTADGIVLFARDITEQRRADAALKASTDALAASEEELRWTIALSSQKPWTADSGGTILKHSANMSAATGHSSEQLLEEKWTTVTHPDDVDGMSQSWSTSVRTGQPYDVEFRMLTTTGQSHWLRARAYPRRDAEGKIVKWYGITDDIDAQKRAEAERKALNDALAESEEELRWTIALSSQMPWTADVHGMVLKHSGSLAALTGHSDEEILGDNWTTMMHPDDLECMRQNWGHCVHTGQPYDIEFRICTTAGDHRWFRARAYPRRDVGGKIVRWYGITDDIDERKRAEAERKVLNDALAASEEELRWTILLSSQEPWTADGDGTITKYSANLTAITGHSNKELLGGKWITATHPDDVDRIVQSWNTSVRTGQVYDIEFRMLSVAGESRWFRAHAYPRRDAEGKIVKWYGITDDIDERKRRAETIERTSAALAVSEEELRWTVKMSTQNPWTADADGKLLSGGDILLEHPDQSTEMLLDKHWAQCVHSEDQPKIDEAWRHSVGTGDPFDVEHRWRTASGEFHWLRARAYPRRDAEGRVVKWYGTTEDIHARKKAEEALRTTEKLAAVGRLATSIAHEINNPLEAVTNLLYLARTSDGLPEVLSYIKSAEQELHRASVITNQTLRFQRQSSAPIALYSDDLIENCLAVFQGKLQNTSVVPERRLRALRPVTCYDGEIRQVFLNLVGNAIDAMQAEGGRLLIRTREATHPASGKPGLVLTVADTGYGIPPEVRKKIFEPFFTTKGLAGTGLGLWVTKDIVARHHGSLRLRSKPARRKTDVDADGHAHGGTVFTLFLPFDAALRHASPVPSSAQRDSLAA